ncbi:MAG: DNA repair and recombination protein RadA [Candidatus Odinarchaeota archaeon]
MPPPKKKETPDLTETASEPDSPVLKDLSTPLSMPSLGTTTGEIASDKNEVPETVAEERTDSVQIISPQKKPASLTEIGIRPSVVEKLKKSGVSNTGVLATMSPKQLADLVAGIGEMTAQKFIAEAREYHGLGVKKGSLVRAQEKARKKISTGLTGLDKILNGGVETGVVTEFYGAFKSGKTQLCHQLSVLVQRPEEAGGLNKSCAWIDTEGTWYSERPVKIAEKFGMDPDQVLDNIYVARSFNSDEQISLTNEIIENLDEFNVGLIIVDSLISHFRGEYIGRGTLATRQQTIGNYLEMLQRPIAIAGVAVVVTNQVSANPDPYALGGPERATGGHVVAHSTNHRVHLVGKSKAVTAQVVDSPVLPPAKCEFVITENGLEDVK